jgi:transcriptional regulator with XRE-family HTH domain
MSTSRKPDEEDKERGRKLARLRKSAGLSQAELAAEIGVSTQQQGKYERGENRMPIGRYLKALKILGAPVRAPGGLAEDAALYQAPNHNKVTLERELERIRDNVNLCLEIVRRL